jgi:NitT/TauT family transport system permease protein
MRTPTIFAAREQSTNFGWVDVVLLLAIFGLLWSVLHFGRGMLVHFDGNQLPQLSSSLGDIPSYAARTLLRMWIAFVFSLFFTFIVGYAAAKNRVARAFILPALDVLQSVPVLGFLSATVAGFMALFPGSLLGAECASIFAIFTGQVWNMTFGFYDALISIPADLQEAASTYGLNRWQRFTTLEVPASMHSLIWNSMMSFGGGWFFVAQSEAISVMNKDIKLPGLGSFMASAVARGDNRAAICAVVAMLAVILATDQLVWRPLVAWADKFKIELCESAPPPSSWFFSLLARSYLFRWLGTTVWRPCSDWVRNLSRRLPKQPATRANQKRSPLWMMVRGIAILTAAWLGWQTLRGVIAGASAVWKHVPLSELEHIAWLGVLTMARVAVMVLIATLLWTPIGVIIGSHLKLARFAEPLAQIAASFPVNMTFPLVVGFYAAHHISMDWGSILLIAMGTQWYILFNVIAGAMAIPNDLKEAARSYGLRGWRLWLNLILPATFPYWVTGACTAAGGAWNASIVAEVAVWGQTTIKANGLGAFISEVTEQGNTPLIICSIVTMSLFVAITNKLLWRRLYALAERRFHLD